MIEIKSRLHGLAPGLAVSGIIAAAAVFLSEHYGAPATLFALLLGMTMHFLSEDTKTAPGVQFASRTLLRIGVALMGLRISYAEVAALGWEPVLCAAALVAATIASGVLLARLMGLGSSLGLLTGGAVAICGASAALAISSVLPKHEGHERNTLFTVVAVTALSTIAMIAYPVLFAKLGMDGHAQGVLIGATIHDVAQVMGAAFSVSDEAGETATIIKVFRVGLLPFVIVVLALSFRASEGATAKDTVPVFVIGFIVLMSANSLGLIPPVVRDLGISASRWLMIAAIAALGIKTSLQAMMQLGGRHVWLVLIETVLLLGAAISTAYLDWL
jgi:uncharacterized integral membrane protein (TIGR00698 family)